MKFIKLLIPAVKKRRQQSTKIRICLVNIRTCFTRFVLFIGTYSKRLQQTPFAGVSKSAL